MTHAFEQSPMPFFEENAKVLETEVENWKFRAKEFILKIWEEIDVPDIDIGDICINEDIDTDVDPNLIRRCQSGCISAGIEGLIFKNYKKKVNLRLGEFKNYESLSYDEWSLFSRIFDSKGLERTRTNLMRRFWSQFSNDFPRLSKVANYVSIFCYSKYY